jgi:hypothetical protein
MTRPLRPVLVLPAAALAVALAPASPNAGQERPLPPPDAFYAAVKANLARADKEQYRYAYRERRSEVHTNPFGKLGTQGNVLYQVTPGDKYGVYHRLLVERDGKPVSGEKRETIDRRERSENNPSIDDVAQALSLQVTRRESSGGRDLIVVHFEPKANVKPRTKTGKMARAFKGNIWVDERTNEIVRVDATAIESLAYGLGVLAWLNEGTRVHLEREPVDTVWLPTSIRLSGEGRALLLRKLDIQFFVEWFDYKKTLK